MTDRFHLHVAEQRDDLLVTVAGVITEASTFAVPDTRGRRVVIDTRGIERLNSMGVRAWIDFVGQLEHRAGEIVIRNLPPAMVAQASMITSFLGRSRIESFLTPWICPRCEHSHEQLHAFRDEVPFALQCPQCSAAMELDWDREAYLAFRTA